MKSLSIKEIFLNSFKYTISDWVAIVILGIILTFLSILNNFNRDIKRWELYQDRISSQNQSLSDHEPEQPLSHPFRIP